MLGTTLLSPLYVVYQAGWHFSSGIVTLVFAVYTAGVLKQVDDPCDVHPWHVGRWPLRQLGGSSS
jgi:hypothetical protein